MASEASKATMKQRRALYGDWEYKGVFAVTEGGPGRAGVLYARASPPRPSDRATTGS